MSSPIDTYPHFKVLIESMVPASSLSGSNLSLFWSVCEEFVDDTGDDDLFFELQKIYETAQLKLQESRK